MQRWMPTTPLLLTLGLVLLTGCPMPSNGSGENNPLLQEALSVGRTDTSRAVKLLEKALTGDPNLAEAHRELGNLHYQKTHDYAAAIYHYQKYLALEPKSQWRSTIEPQIERSRIELAHNGLASMTDVDFQRRLQSLMAEKESLQARVNQLTEEKTQLMAALETARSTNRPADRARPENGGGMISRRENEPTTRERPAETDQSTSRRPTTVARTHRVQRGETFYSIGRAHGFTVDQMQRANPGVRADSLRIGQEVNLPR